MSRVHCGDSNSSGLQTILRIEGGPHVTTPERRDSPGRSGRLAGGDLADTVHFSPVNLRIVHAQEDTKAIGTVRVESNQPGQLQVSWGAPTDTPRDYRIMWARVDEDFLTWTDTRGNAFPTTPSYTSTGLDEGVRYKVKVRARFNGPSGPWCRPSRRVRRRCRANGDAHGDGYRYASANGNAHTYSHTNSHGG